MDYNINAKGKRLGRLATEIAVILQGKTIPSYEKRIEGTNRVIVKNIEHIEVSGKKREQKIYYRHAGALGHLKEVSYAKKFEKDPSWVLRRAVRLMLPKNKLQAKRLKKLIIENVSKTEE
ncbi:50S ribosomal protein L13 [Candidatus Jorgensenbacteria bacterium RIFCSPLOWO2_01_FULL_45_25b]|uniref:Large ribosomal subunit protein uL13 n=1 Tax=Candidatus Jorgensenbacteria bacterium RIFCSPLOWO2_01_FULL_45_25b TaxID=1798471 RepID=A0A1F6BT28_9BACT|nr:MAG: 50S ribosomal protein L13 [Candidatus Jorgensenbacteria bacterium RIFCSPLOWO2_01_FULL_45_25b]